jgi:NAD(P)-dependent dehydrogenase (short-subunit alcohol dehydrogenase family)
MADVALVCGGGGALGSALVAALHERGDRVVAVDRAAAAGGPEGVRHEALDLTKADELAALWERLAADGETPRWVVNAAGGWRGGDVADTDAEKLEFMQDLNLGTAWWSCREAARHLSAGGAIVNIGSRAGVSGSAGAAAYAVSKAGVIRLTEVLAAELREKRIRVNAVLPSVIDTPANRASMSAADLRNAVAPADLAAVVAFLLSDAAAAITGAILPAYGYD